MNTSKTMLASLLAGLLATSVAFAQAPAGGQADPATAKSAGTKTSTVDKAAV